VARRRGADANAERLLPRSEDAEQW